MIVDQPLAPLAVLAFLGMAVFTVALTVITLVTWLAGNKAISRLTFKVLAGGLGVYFVVLLSVSAFSKDCLLRQGAEKHYCEMDCHLAYSVAKVERVNEVPAEFGTAGPYVPHLLLIVTLRTRFDETTIGPNRGNGPLTPNPRAIELRSDGGKPVAPLAIVGTPLSQALRPAESYETRILFAAPIGATGLKLWLRDADWPDTFLIGHENSPLHGKAYFDLKS